MRRIKYLSFALLALSGSTPAYADLTALIPESELKAIAEELSGETAKRNLDTITLYHRMRASKQFHSAAEHIHDQLQRYGLDQVQIRTYPADGKTMFGTQKSRLAWDVEFAELWELDEQGE